MLNRIQLYNYNINNNLYSKLLPNNYLDLAKLNKISLSINFNNKNLSNINILYTLLFLELITNQKSSLIFLKNRKNKTKNIKILGCKITLHGFPMYNFLDYFVNIVLPKVKHLDKLKMSENQQEFTLCFSNFRSFIELEDDLESFDFMRRNKITIIFNGNNTNLRTFLNYIGIIFN